MSNSNFEYIVFKSNGSYGINACNEKEVVCSIADISTNEVLVNKLATEFNKHDLSILHFRQAVEDFVIDLK